MGFSVPLWFRFFVRVFKMENVLSVHVLSLKLDAILCVV